MSANFFSCSDLFAPKKTHVAKKIRAKRKKNRIITFIQKHQAETIVAGGVIIAACLALYYQFCQSPKILWPKPNISPAGCGIVGDFDGKGPAIGGFLKDGLFGLPTSRSPGAQLFTGIRNRTPGDDETIKILPDNKGLLGTGQPTIKVSTLRKFQDSSIVVVDGTSMKPDEFKEKVGKLVGKKEEILQEKDTEGTVCHGQYCLSFVKQAGITDDGKACYQLKDGPIDEDRTFVMLSMSGFKETKSEDISLEKTKTLWRTVLAAAKAMKVSKISSPALGMGVFNQGADVNKLYFQGLCQELQRSEFAQIKEFRINPIDKNLAILKEVLDKTGDDLLKKRLIPVKSDSLLLAETLAQQEISEQWALINPSNGNVTAGKAEIGNGFCGNIGPAEEFFTAMTTASICSYPKDKKDVFLKSEKWDNPMSVAQALAAQ